MISRPDPFPPKAIEAVKQWEKREKSRLLGFVTAGFPSGFPQISPWIVKDIRKECKKFEKVETLDVLMDCGGGSPNSTYQLVNFLRTRCERLRVFIPEWAKSAATLFCLGADELWMSETAELGPLDAQIYDPRNPQDELVSALDQFRSMDYLKTLAFEILDTYISVMDKSTRMRLIDKVKVGNSFVTDLMSSLYSQLDPFHFGGSYRALDVGVEYGKRLMSRYAYSHWTLNDIEKLINKLTWQYPSHGFIIDREEARELKLQVFDLTGKSEKDAEVILEEVNYWVGFVESEPNQAKSSNKNTPKKTKGAKK